MGATIRDVAKKTGLSLGTISKYINGQPVRESNRVLIEQAIAELQFKPNKIAKGLRNSQTFSVAVLLPMLTSNFCTSMISTINPTCCREDTASSSASVTMTRKWSFKKQNSFLTAW